MSTVPILCCSQDARNLSLELRTAAACFLALASAGRLSWGLHLQTCHVFFKALTDLQKFFSPLKTVTFAV